ncbi:hypothetical protein O1L60_23285 [Streptomyces diastatochromogenes]|nr:hypothetical protein [Streptomyces diastatochromogenes]
MIFSFTWKARMARQSAADCFPSTRSPSSFSTRRWWMLALAVQAAPTALLGRYSTSSSTSSSGSGTGTPPTSSRSGGSTWSGVSIGYSARPPPSTPGTSGSSADGASADGASADGASADGVSGRRRAGRPPGRPGRRRGRRVRARARRRGRTTAARYGFSNGSPTHQSAPAPRARGNHGWANGVRPSVWRARATRPPSRPATPPQESATSVAVTGAPPSDARRAARPWR